MPQQSSTLDGLPRQFIGAMRTLFDIMDDKHVGLVNLTDIENRWQDDGTKGLPKGVLESLRKVTPPNGMLTFERFCAGLKICLLRNQGERKETKQLRVIDVPFKEKQIQIVQPSRSPSAPLLDLDDDDDDEPIKKDSPSNAPWIREPSYVKQRTLSMPHLLGDDPERKTFNFKGPPKPPRNIERIPPFEGGGSGNNVNVPGVGSGGSGAGSGVGNGVGNGWSDMRNVDTRTLDREEIRTALQNWQMSKLQESQDGKRPVALGTATMVHSNRSSGDGKPNEGLYQKKANVRRREPRRHTLQNGIDYNTLKRIKQMEQEKSVLVCGLQTVDRAREWYLKRLTALNDKMKYVANNSSAEQWSEAQQERLELERGRVFEVNRHLDMLMDGGRLPIHMNLALQPNHVNRLKHQNHLLNQEVTKKGERIVALEREKAALIRELLQTRAAQVKSSLDMHHEEVVF